MLNNLFKMLATKGADRKFPRDK